MERLFGRAPESDSSPGSGSRYRRNRASGKTRSRRRALHPALLGYPTAGKIGQRAALTAQRACASWTSTSRKLYKPYFIAFSLKCENGIQKLCFPVLLTYDSSKFKDHSQACEEFKAKLITEIQKHHASFQTKITETLKKQIVIHLILFPLKDKATLVTAMDNELRKLQWQQK